LNFKQTSTAALDICLQFKYSSYI